TAGVRARVGTQRSEWRCAGDESSPAGGRLSRSTGTVGTRFMGYTALGLDRPNRLSRTLALYRPLLFGETTLVTLASATLLLALTLPAFGSYFIGEDFTYLG